MAGRFKPILNSNRYEVNTLLAVPVRFRGLSSFILSCSSNQKEIRLLHDTSGHVFCEGICLSFDQAIVSPFSVFLYNLCQWSMLYISPEYLFSPFFFFTWFTWGNFHIANVPSLNWFSSDESKDCVLGLVMTRENPYPRELPLLSHSCKGTLPNVKLFQRKWGFKFYTDELCR
jgi:hypothetical protein